MRSILTIVAIVALGGAALVSEFRPRTCESQGVSKAEKAALTVLVDGLLLLPSDEEPAYSAGDAVIIGPPVYEHEIIVPVMDDRFATIFRDNERDIADIPK